MNIKKILFIALVILLAAPLLFVGAQEKEEVYMLKWGSIEAVGGEQNQVMDWLIPEIKERSGDRIIIDYYPANQLGNSDEQIDGVILGTIDVLPLGCNVMGSLGEVWSIDAIPFIFESFEQRKAYNESSLNVERHQDLLERHGLATIGYNWYRTPHYVQTKRPIYKVEDVAGLKMRVPGAKAQFLAWQELGANPLTTPWGDAYMALMQGVAEGVSGHFGGLTEQRFYEVAKYLILLPTESSYEHIMMNNNKLQSMPEDLQQILLEVVKEGGDRYTKLGFDNEVKYRQTQLEAGVKFIDVDVGSFIAQLKNLPQKLEDGGVIRKSLLDEVKTFLMNL